VEKSIPGFVATVEGSVDDEGVQALKDRCGGPCGTITWFLCLIAGYQAIFECFTRMVEGTLDITCSKNVAGHASLSVPYDQPDESAGELAMELNVAPPESTFDSVESFSSDRMSTPLIAPT
jgi:hypothetical protein